MSVVSSSSSRSHKLHHFYYNQPLDLNQSVVKGYVSDLFSSASDRRIGSVIVNGFTSYVDLKEINQVTFSILLENGSLSLNTQFHYTRDSIGKITFPGKVLARDNNGRMIMLIMQQKETDLNRIQLSVQII